MPAASAAGRLDLLRERLEVGRRARDAEHGAALGRDRARRRGRHPGGAGDEDVAALEPAAPRVRGLRHATASTASGSSSAPSASSRARRSAAVDVPRHAARGRRERRGGAGRLAHRHARRHRPRRGVRVVGRGEAAAGDEQPLDARAAAGTGRGSRTPRRRPTYCHAGVAARAVVLDRRAAQRDLVGEAAPAEDVVAGQPVVAVDPPALAHADRRATWPRPPTARTRARGRAGSGGTRAPGGGPRPRRG